MVNILGREGSDKRMGGIFYVEMVHLVLLFGSYMCVVNLCLEKALMVLHHQAVWTMAGNRPSMSTGWYMGIFIHWGGARGAEIR